MNDVYPCLDRGLLSGYFQYGIRAGYASTLPIDERCSRAWMRIQNCDFECSPWTFGATEFGGVGQAPSVFSVPIAYRIEW